MPASESPTIAMTMPAATVREAPKRCTNQPEVGRATSDPTEIAKRVSPRSLADRFRAALTLSLIHI